jgi:hypothetical protein
VFGHIIDPVKFHVGISSSKSSSAYIKLTKNKTVRKTLRKQRILALYISTFLGDNHGSSTSVRSILFFQNSFNLFILNKIMLVIKIKDPLITYCEKIKYFNHFKYQKNTKISVFLFGCLLFILNIWFSTCKIRLFVLSILHFCLYIIWYLDRTYCENVSEIEHVVIQHRDQDVVFLFFIVNTLLFLRHPKSSKKLLVAVLFFVLFCAYISNLLLRFSQVLFYVLFSFVFMLYYYQTPQ